MRIKERNYPHPVLSPWSDDITPYDLNCDISVKFEKPYYYFIYHFSLDNSAICELLRNGNACFILHVECGATFYRKAFTFLWTEAEPRKILEGSIAIPYNEIAVSAEASVFVCSGTTCRNYTPTGMHPDYQNQFFKIENADVLAVGKTIICPLDRENEPFKNISSIITFSKSEETTEDVLTVEFNGDKLVGVMSLNLWNTYIQLNNAANAKILSTMLVIPILMEGLNRLRSIKLTSDETLLEEYRNKRWFRLLERKLNALGIKIEAESVIVLYVAQKILDFPYLRASKSLADLRASFEQQGGV
jgi:hypothetical protein